MHATTAAAHGGVNVLHLLHPDIISSHILVCLDGPDLASAAASSSLLRPSSDLWAKLCRLTWPSTASPLLTDVIPAFSGGASAFFSHAYPTPAENHHLLNQPPPPSKLISAVDIHYDGKLVLTKVQETETRTKWFRCSPFRVDLLEPKGSSTSIAIPRQPHQMELSWILIDPIGLRAVNLSSQKPVAAETHWLTGEVEVRFASILAVDHRGKVLCRVVVTCGESESGEMQVREVSMEIEDLDGKHLNGRDSLVFLHAALEGKKGTGKNRVQESERRYKEYVEMKIERRERKLRIERVLDLLLVAFGVSILVSLFCFLWCSR